MKKIKAYVEGRILWAMGTNKTQTEGHFHFISFTPLKWETIKEIWSNSQGDKAFFACGNLDKYSVLRITPKGQDNLGICSGYRGARVQYLFIDYDNLDLNQIDREVTEIIKMNGLRRGIIVQSSPELKIVREIENMDGTKFYDYNREKLYKFLIQKD